MLRDGGNGEDTLLEAVEIDVNVNGCARGASGRRRLSASAPSGRAFAAAPRPAGLGGVLPIPLSSSLSGNSGLGSRFVENREI